MAGAVVGAVTEFVTQKFIEKRDKIDVKAILYEGVVGGVTSVIGGVGGAAKKAGKTAKTAKAGAKEATLAFAEDLGRQVFVDGKSLKEVDYGQSLEAGASAGVTAVIDELDSVLGTKKQLSTTNRKKASQATGVIDDAADAAPRKRANALPDAEGMPNRGAVKNAAGGLADADSAGNAGRKSLTKNQNKIQSQIVDSTLSGNTIKTKSKSKEIPPLPYTEKWKKYFREVYGEENVEWQNRDYGMGGGRSSDIKYSNKMKKWIPMDADGNPIPLKEHKQNNTHIPLPDPEFEGKPHIVFGGRISSKTNELYLQAAIFDGKEDWLKVNGHPIPRAVIDWTNHYMPWAHDNPHQHVFYYDFKEKKWLRGDAEYFEPSVFFRLIKAGYTSR